MFLWTRNQKHKDLIGEMLVIVCFFLMEISNKWPIVIWWCYYHYGEKYIVALKFFLEDLGISLRGVSESCQTSKMELFVKNLLSCSNYNIMLLVNLSSTRFTFLYFHLKYLIYFQCNMQSFTELYMRNRNKK